MRRRFVFVPCFWVMWTVVVASVSELRAAQPVDGIPASASIVVRVKDPQALSTNFDSYVNSFSKLKIPGVLDFLKEAPEGVDWSQGLWLVFFTKAGATPSMVVVEVASDLEQARRSLTKNDASADGAGVEFVGNVVVLSDDKQAKAEIRKCLQGESKALWATIDDASKRLFDASDISIVVNAPKLAEDFASDVERFESFLKSWINDFCDDPVDEDVAFYEFIKASSHHVLKLGLQAVSDLKWLTAGITISDTTLRYEDRWQFKTDSPSAAVLAQHPASDLGLMTRFPSNQAAYLNLQSGYSPAFFGWVLQLMECMAKKSGHDQKAMFSGLNADLAKLRFGEYAAYMTDAPVRQGENAALRLASVALVEPGELWRDVTHRMAKLDQIVGDAQFKNWTYKRRSTLGTLEPAIAHIGGIAVDRFPARKSDVPSSGKDSQSISPSLPFIAEGADQFYAFGPRRTFATTGGDTSDLVRLTKLMDPAKPANAELETLRGSLFPQANLIALIDVARVAVKLLRSGLSKDAAAEAVEFNEWKFEPSYIGYAAKCEATAVRTQLQIPARQASNIASILIPIIMAN